MKEEEVANNKEFQNLSLIALNWFVLTHCRQASERNEMIRDCYAILNYLDKDNLLSYQEGLVVEYAELFSYFIKVNNPVITIDVHHYLIPAQLYPMAEYLLELSKNIAAENDMKVVSLYQLSLKESQTHGYKTKQNDAN